MADTTKTGGAPDAGLPARVNRRRLLQGAAAAGVGVAAWSAPNITTLGFAPAYALVSSGCKTIARTFTFSRSGNDITVACTGTCGDVTVSPPTPTAGTVTITMPEPDDGPPGIFTIAVTRTGGDASLTVSGTDTGCKTTASVSGGSSVTITGNATAVLSGGFPNNATAAVTISISCGPACP